MEGMNGLLLHYHRSEPILLESCNPIGREPGANSLDHCMNSITLGNNAIVSPLNNDIKKNSSSILPPAAIPRQVHPRLQGDWNTCYWFDGSSRALPEA